jgi:glycosyltransferase involved in cell wall biosynthesis
MTVQNKIWEAVAMARPVLSGDSPTIRTAFRHGEEIYLVERGNPEKLAQAIALLADDPALCARLAQGGYARFQAGNTTARLGEQLAGILTDLVSTRRDRKKTSQQGESAGR